MKDRSKGLGGRPKGSKNLPVIRDYFTQEEIAELVADIKEQAKTDNKLKIWLGDHIFGKAVQPTEGNVTGDIKISFDPAFKDAFKD